MTGLLLACAVFFGAVTQRLTGIGFALVASPLFVLLLGPLQGVVITNVFGVVTAASIYVFHIRGVEYRKVLPLLGAVAIAVIPGALLAKTLPAASLAILAGSLVLFALAVSVVARRLRGIDSWQGLVAGGLLSGFMNVLAGVGGPAVTAYAVASRWEHRRFAVSVQFYFAVLGMLSLLGRGIPPTLTAVEWILTIVALAAGMLCGVLLTRVVPVRIARAACVCVAALGGATVIVRGVLELWA